MTDYPTPTPTAHFTRRVEAPDPVRHAAYLRVSALRNAVEYYNGRPGVYADDVVEAAELFHDFLTRKDTP